MVWGQSHKLKEWDIENNSVLKELNGFVSCDFSKKYLNFVPILPQPMKHSMTLWQKWNRIEIELRGELFQKTYVYLPDLRPDFYFFLKTESINYITLWV